MDNQSNGSQEDNSQSIPEEPVAKPKFRERLHWAGQVLREHAWGNKDKVGRTIREAIMLVAAITTAFGIWFAYLALKATQRSLHLSATTTIFSNNEEPLKFLAQHPDLLDFFDKDVREKDMTDEMLMKKLEGLSLENRKLVYLGCEFYADYMQLTFMNRELIHACDWNGWWKYYGDMYDESPVFREYLKKRSDWYDVDNALSPENRKSHYKKPQVGDTPCADPVMLHRGDGQ